MVPVPTSSLKTALLAIKSPETFSRFEALLVPAGIDIKHVAHGEVATAFAVRRHFDVVVSEYPLEGLRALDFFQALRGSGSASRAARVIILIAGASSTALEQHNREIGQGVSMTATVSHAMRMAAQALGIGDRVESRFLVNLETYLGGVRTQRACQTENVSSSGMLLRTRRLLPLGTEVPFHFELPNELGEVNGTAEVVRHADQVRENVVGIGIRFLSFDTDGAHRVSEFVSTQRFHTDGTIG